MPQPTVFAALLPLVLTAASPSPSLAPAGDHVLTLAGTWACRTVHGSVIQRVGRRDGDLLDVGGNVQRADGTTATVDDRYTLDHATGAWHVRLSAGSPGATDGTAAPWSGAAWDIVLHDAQGEERAHYELLADGTLRRTIARPATAVPGLWRPIDAELCAQGEAPPPADACIAENFPAFTISSSRPPTIDVPPGTRRGTVAVVIKLDEHSQVTSAAVRESPSANLNPIALETVRLSRFQTEIRNCRPIAADYLFSVDIKG